jgi:pimeloyl-ACP methyl ester carboxylesterase
LICLGGDHAVTHPIMHAVRRLHSKLTILLFVATNVTTGIVPRSGHWIMDENPTATTALIVNFLSN